MNYVILDFTFLAGLFVGMLVLLEAGRRIGRRRLAGDPEGVRTGVGTVDTVVFSLFGLLVAFTFAGAASRFDHRRELIVQEANDIGTAYLRLDLLSPREQPELRALFRSYLDLRLEVYRRLPDLSAANEMIKQCSEVQDRIWSKAMAATEAAEHQQARILLVPALNAMFDTSTTRIWGTKIHPPMIIFAMLFGLALGSSVLVGYGMACGRTRAWLHMFTFAATVSLTTFVILDLEYPRLGLIRVDAMDRVLEDVRAGMK